MQYLYIVTLIACLISILIRKESKLLNILCFVSLIVLACAPRVGYDTEAANYIYQSVASDPNFASTNTNYMTMRAYMWLMSVLINAGTPSFYWFKYITLLVGVFLTSKTIGKEIQSYSTFVFFYLISTFSNDAIQHRNTLALLLFLCGFHFLQENKKRSKLKYSICIFAAILLHFSFVIFLALLFIDVNRKSGEKLYKKLFIITIGTCFVFSLARNMLNPIANLLIRVLKNPKLVQFFYNRINWGFITPLLLGVLQIALLMFIYKKNITRVPGDCKKTICDNTFVKYVLCANFLLFPTCILLLFSLSTYRIMRDLFVLDLIVISNYCRQLRIRNDGRIIFILITIIVCIMNLIFFNFITGPASDIWFAVLQGEWFFAN